MIQMITHSRTMDPHKYAFNERQALYLFLTVNIGFVNLCRCILYKFELLRCLHNAFDPSFFWTGSGWTERHPDIEGAS
jgi:hypothetical protein